MNREEFDDLPGLSPRRKDDDSDVEEDDDCCSADWNSPDNNDYCDDEFEPPITNDENEVILEETVNPNDVGVYYPHTVDDPMKEIIHLDDFKIFGNKESNAYFWQEYICNQDDEANGGLRGVAWRSLFRRKQG